jgi:CRP/FNR family cyclic AMP-dependent transcriptional regulator
MGAVGEALSQVTMFQNVPQKTIDRLERMSNTRTFKQGAEIVKEGTEGVGFFLITKGAVKVTRSGVELTTFGAGDFFGEMALLDNYRRSATVTTTEETDTIALLRSDFMAELRGDADLAVEMLVLIARRLHVANERFAAMQ